MMNSEVAKEAEQRLLNVFSIKYKFSDEDDFQTNRAELLSKLHNLITSITSLLYFICFPSYIFDI